MTSNFDAFEPDKFAYDSGEEAELSTDA